MRHLTDTSTWELEEKQEKELNTIGYVSKTIIGGCIVPDISKENQRNIWEEECED